MALNDARDLVDDAFTREGHRGQSYENAFAGATSFMRRSYTKDLTGVDLAITGIPFDQAVTHRPGARFGPRAIREASSLQPCDPPFGWDVNPLTDFDMIDYGDMAFDYARVQDFPGTLEAHIKAILDRDVGVISLGGDHYISYPILRAFAARFGPVSLIQFDAHTDTWVDDDLERVDHGTGMYKAMKLGLIDAEHSVQVGIRTNNPAHSRIPVIEAPEAHLMGPHAVAARIKEIVGDRPAYLSFDIDGLDPAFAPGTGTPVWGGMSSVEAGIILRDLAGINLVGGDVVEVAPAYDTTGATAIAGAHIAFEIACLYCHNLAERRGGAA